MTIAPSETYVQNLEKYCGQVDMGGVVEQPEEYRLANRMLGFIFTGLSTYYKIPVAYFLVKQLTADQQHLLLQDVLRKVEAIGFKVLRVVTENLSVNVTMFSKMNNNTHHPVVPHRPNDVRRRNEVHSSDISPAMLKLRLLSRH